MTVVIKLSYWVIIIEKVNYILQLQNKGKTRHEIKDILGYKHLDSMPKYMRKRGYKVKNDKYTLSDDICHHIGNTQKNKRNIRYKKIETYIKLIHQIVTIYLTVAPTYNYSCIEIKNTHININLYYIKKSYNICYTIQRRQSLRFLFLGIIFYGVMNNVNYKK